MFLGIYRVGLKIFTNFKTNKLADAQCKSNNGSLASIPNAFVNSYIYYIASENDATSVWLGIDCFNGDVNTCINKDGNPFIFDNFYPGQPNVDGNCVYLSAIGRDSQKWLTFDCSQKFQFVCEVAAGANGPVLSPTTTTKTQSKTTVRASLPVKTTTTVAPTTYYTIPISGLLSTEIDVVFLIDVTKPAEYLYNDMSQFINSLMYSFFLGSEYARIGLIAVFGSNGSDNLYEAGFLSINIHTQLAAYLTQIKSGWSDFTETGEYAQVAIETATSPGFTSELNGYKRSINNHLMLYITANTNFSDNPSTVKALQSNTYGVITIGYGPGATDAATLTK